MADGDVVANVEVTRRYAIHEYDMDDETLYGWYNDLGGHSQDLFDSIRDAIENAKNQ